MNKNYSDKNRPRSHKDPGNTEQGTNLTEEQNLLDSLYSSSSKSNQSHREKLTAMKENMSWNIASWAGIISGITMALKMDHPAAKWLGGLMIGGLAIIKVIKSTPYYEENPDGSMTPILEKDEQESVQPDSFTELMSMKIASAQEITEKNNKTALTLTGNNIGEMSCGLN